MSKQPAAILGPSQKTMATLTDYVALKQKLGRGQYENARRCVEIRSMSTLSMPRARALAKQMLFNSDVCFYHAHLVIYRTMHSECTSRHVSPPQPLSEPVLRAAHQLAESLNPLARPSYLSRYWYKLKQSGNQNSTEAAATMRQMRIRDLRAGGRRVRIICSPHVEARVCYSMFGSILREAFAPTANVYDIKGRGKDLMTRRISAALEEGQNHAYVGDIASSFECFELGRVGEYLPLPNSAVANLLDAGAMRWQRDYRKEAIAYGSRMPPLDAHDNVQVGQGPIGLVPGSQCSNVIQSWVFSRIVQSVPPRCTLFIYSDNVLLLGDDASIVQNFAERLESLFSASPFGPFLLRGQMHDARQTFTFVGYEHSLDRRNTARISIPLEKWLSLPRQIVSDFSPEQLQSIVDDLSAPYDFIHEAVRQKLTGYSAVSDMAFERDSLEDAILDWVSLNAGGHR